MSAMAALQFTRVALKFGKGVKFSCVLHETRTSFICRRTASILSSSRPQHGSCRPQHTSASRKNVFKVIPNDVDHNCDKYKQNLSASKLTVDKYNEVFAVATGLGGAKAVDRHVNKNKKILVTDRLKLLFDNFEETLEIGRFAGMSLQYGNIPRAGIYAGT